MARLHKGLLTKELLRTFPALRTQQNKGKQIYGCALKERRNGRAGKRSSEHLKMGNDKPSTKKLSTRLLD